MRYLLPQPYRDLDHTADVAVAVEGATAEEALARLVLAQSALLTGGAPVRVVGEERVRVEDGGALADAAVLALRELLYRFATERVVAGWCEVLRLDSGGAELAVGFGRYDPDAHAEGLDLKAVTWHAARLERDGEVWRAQVVFDI